MANNVKISELTDATTSNGSDEVIVLQGGDTKRLSLAELLHNSLGGRTVSAAHPISAITGLQDALDAKQPVLSNATTLAKITESGGEPLWDGSAWPGGTGGGVSSFNSRTGAVTPQESDYDTFYTTPAEVAATYATKDVATTLSDGLMSTSDKTKLDSLLIDESTTPILTTATGAAELQYLEGVTSNVQTQLDDKLATSKISDAVYDATAWNGNTDAPTKNAVRDKIESLSVGAGTPGGSDSHVQYNNDGAFGGESNLTYNDTDKALTVNSDGSSFVTSLDGKHGFRGRQTGAFFEVTNPTVARGFEFRATDLGTASTFPYNRLTVYHNAQTASVSALTGFPNYNILTRGGTQASVANTATGVTGGYVFGVQHGGTADNTAAGWYSYYDATGGTYADMSLRALVSTGTAQRQEIVKINKDGLETTDLKIGTSSTAGQVWTASDTAGNGAWGDGAGLKLNSPVYVTGTSTYNYYLSPTPQMILLAYSSGTSVVLPDPSAALLGKTVVIRTLTTGVQHSVTTQSGGNSILNASAASPVATYSATVNYTVFGRFTVCEIAGGTTYAWVGW